MNFLFKLDLALIPAIWHIDFSSAELRIIFLKNNYTSVVFATAVLFLNSLYEYNSTNI